MNNPRIQRMFQNMKGKENRCLDKKITVQNSPYKSTSDVANYVKDVRSLMTRCENLVPPSYLLLRETSTSESDVSFLSSMHVVSSQFCTSESSVYPDSFHISQVKEPLLTTVDVSSTSHNMMEDKLTMNLPGPSSNVLLDDLSLSSSESDPFGGDDEDNDPNYELKATVGRHNQVPINDSEFDSSDVEDTSEKEKKYRKRKRKYNTWRRTEIKASRNSGKSYINWKGNLVPERKIKVSCKCRMKCSDKIKEGDREKIFLEYWNLADINRQRDYISKFVQCNNKARTRIRNNADKTTEDLTSRRNFTFVYYLQVDTKKVQVCKLFFLHTLSISAQMIRTVINKIGSTGVVREDKRGKVCKNSMLDESVKQSIRDHINCFETVESHYCRQKTTRLYLPATLNISKMYSLYEEYCQNNNIEQKATESLYRTIFNTEFNMSFFRPKKDLCDTCHDYEHSSAEEKLKLEETFQLHVRNKNMARDLKNIDKEKAKENTTFCAAAFDLQQVLSTPKSDVGLAYYKLKLSTYNFTVFDLAIKDSFCYMWYECIAKRGSSEIGSCLLLFIENQIQKGVKEFSFYSDNCSGQNRNKYLFSLYNYLCQKDKIKIRHTFLEKGHTQSEGDSVHSVIEKAARNVSVYTPEQWYTIVRFAKRKQPYVVIELEQANILNLKSLQEKTTINWDKDEQNEKVTWNKIKIVETDFHIPNVVFIKYSYSNDDPFKKIFISKKGRKSLNVNARDFCLKPLNTTLLPISKKKYDHLKFLCDKRVILNPYHNFFKNLPFSEKETAKDSDNDN
ncbi:uncharacterized protein [Diabrotica undecimpunctata]|uniref:uncharacterized protein n=1 Tax=Diabrotica undecimpunctata TaxID=50387 RepID=UPI003B637540